MADVTLEDLQKSAFSLAYDIVLHGIKEITRVANGERRSPQLDEFLTLACKCVSDVLRDMKSPGVDLWDQIQAGTTPAPNPPQIDPPAAPQPHD